MKKRRPLHENPFFAKNSKYEKQSKKVYGPELEKTTERQCKSIKNGKRCKNTLPDSRYFYCKKCQVELPYDSGLDSIFYR